METPDPIVQRLTDLAPAIPSAALQPARFFLAGSGVLTLAFKGFTAGLLRLKAEISPKLAPEFPGSRWPKITLGALNEDGPLTDDEVRLLWTVMSRTDSLLLADHRPVLIDQITFVERSKRSMVGACLGQTLRLGSTIEEDVPPEHGQYVLGVLDQWKADPSTSYLQAIRRPGHRRDHYECGSEDQKSLVSFLPADIPGLDELMYSVDRLLPGRYHWFDRSGRHLTIRSLRPAGPTPEIRTRCAVASS